MMDPIEKIHFTELSCYVELLAKCLQQNGVKFVGPRMSPEQDVFSAEMVALEGHQDRFVRVRVVQLQYILQFLLSCRMDGQPYEGVDDSFWIDYRNYLPKKIFNSYRLRDSDASKVDRLSTIFRNRIVQLLNPPQPQEQTTIDLPTCIVNNIVLFNKLLGPRSFKNLEMTNRKMYQLLHSEKQYMKIYEGRWGKTGFQLGEINWMKHYRKQILKRQAG